MEALCINDAMRRVVDKLKAIYHHLEVTCYAKYISFDLGFTNQMNYYSDLIFKGYINNWGEPVINGGRYNQLSENCRLYTSIVNFCSGSILTPVRLLSLPISLKNRKPKRLNIMIATKASVT